MTEKETERLRKKIRRNKKTGKNKTEEQQSKHILVLQKLLFLIFAHQNFVKACPAGWIPTTRDQNDKIRQVYIQWSDSYCGRRKQDSAAPVVARLC